MAAQPWCPDLNPRRETHTVPIPKVVTGKGGRSEHLWRPPARANRVQTAKFHTSPGPRLPKPKQSARTPRIQVGGGAARGGGGQPQLGTGPRRGREEKTQERRPLTQNGGAEAEAGAPGGATRPGGPSQIAASWTRALGPSGPHRSAPGPARSGRPQPADRVAARCPRGRGRCRRGRGARRGRLGLTPRSAPGMGSSLTSDAPRVPLEEPEEGGGAARMNGAGGCSLAGPGPHRSRQPRRARPPPALPNARLLVAGRPRPTVPSADVTHSRRSASSLRFRAAPAPTANPPARPRCAAPPRRRGRRPASLQPRRLDAGPAGAGYADPAAPHGPSPRHRAPSLRPGRRHPGAPSSGRWPGIKE
ncbi:uncharacterized protein LOC120365088 [Saimiri boliviensis]|uniref:uncharacterized protein LOC120365088 n=1 Tax=Saimiri boliviensis TaxID=27679 RepID=UPI003D784296